MQQNGHSPHYLGKVQGFQDKNYYSRIYAVGKPENAVFRSDFLTTLKSIPWKDAKGIIYLKKFI